MEGTFGASGAIWAKKFGVSNSGSHRHFQPRLPGSVVGDASMAREAQGGKITEDNDL